jgi:L,D-transpeptidase YcbB
VNRSFPVNVLFFFIAGCTFVKSPPSAQTPGPVNCLPFEFNEQSLRSTPLISKLQVESFYKANGFRMAWVDTFQIHRYADSLIQLIHDTEYLGLDPSDYHVKEIAELVSSPFSHDQAVVLDIFLTDAFFSVRQHLKKGRLIPKKLTRLHLDSLNDENENKTLRRAIAANSIRATMEEREPKHRQYQLLKQSLKKIIDGNVSDTISIKRRDQIIATLERWRWEGPLPARYLSVNIPAFQLKIVESDSVVFESKVIVGKKETPTPNIKSVIRSFIIYPYWHVPKSILDEILPSIQQDTSYLKKHNYDVLDKKGKVIKPSLIDWKSYDHETFPYTLRQREGSENTMGVIKFVFPNKYGVYLHDTNARGLFSKTDRALSHGCIRVHKAVPLAHYLAKDDDTYVDPADLDQYLLVRHKMVVNVVKPLPIHLDYFSVEVQDGETIFHDDVYDWDKQIIDALNGVVNNAEVF